MNTISQGRLSGIFTAAKRAMEEADRVDVCVATEAVFQDLTVTELAEMAGLAVTGLAFLALPMDEVAKLLRKKGRALFGLEEEP